VEQARRRPGDYAPDATGRYSPEEESTPETSVFWLLTDLMMAVSHVDDQWPGDIWPGITIESRP